jgi:hypothetical protein
LNAAAAEKDTRPTVEGLTALRSGDRAVVSYRVANGLSEEALERIDSGISVIFRHRIEIVSKRAFPLIPDKVRARVVVETTAEYDALTKRYALLRRIEVRSRQKKLSPPPDEQTQTTLSQDEMRAWMTELREVEVFDPARRLEGERLRVRVESEVGRRYLLLIFPASLTASAEQALEP